MGNTDGQLTANLLSVAQHRHKPFYPLFLQLERSTRCAPRRVSMYAGPCGLLLGPTSEERTSTQNRTHVTTSNTSHEGHSPLYNYCNYKSCMLLPLRAKDAACRKGPSQKQKCLSADAAIQNRRHSPAQKSLTAWEVRPVPGLSFQLLLWSESDKGCRGLGLHLPSSPVDSPAASSNLFGSGSRSRGWSRTRHSEAHHHV